MAVYCSSCGASNPDGGRFCFKCGKPLESQGAGSGPFVAGSAPPPPGAAPTGPVDLKCTACGAPLHPMGEEMVVTCEYCGSSIALSGQGWKMIQTHTMLVPKVTDEAKALEICRTWMDQGLLHRHLYEESKLVDGKLSIVPYWIIPVSAVTNYVYESGGAEAAQIGGTLAAAALVGAALGGGGRRGGMGMGFVPIMGMGAMGAGMGAGQSARRAAELAGQYNFPVIAVRGLQAYQPRDYQFDLMAREPFDKRRLPSGAPILNGDVGEDAAQYTAKNYVTEVQAQKAHKQHRMVQQLTTKADASEGELMHVPTWYFTFQHKKEQTILLVDGQKMAIMNSVT